MLRRCHTTRPYPLKPIAWFVEARTRIKIYDAKPDASPLGEGDAMLTAGQPGDNLLLTRMQRGQVDRLYDYDSAPLLLPILALVAA